MFYKRDMKYFSKYVRKSQDTGGYGKLFCSAIKFQMWSSVLYYQEISDADADDGEEEV